MTRGPQALPTDYTPSAGRMTGSSDVTRLGKGCRLSDQNSV